MSTDQQTLQRAVEKEFPELTTVEIQAIVAEAIDLPVTEEVTTEKRFEPGRLLEDAIGVATVGTAIMCVTALFGAFSAGSWGDVFPILSLSGFLLFCFSWRVHRVAQRVTISREALGEIKMNQEIRNHPPLTGTIVTLPEEQPFAKRGSGPVWNKIVADLADPPGLKPPRRSAISYLMEETAKRDPETHLRIMQSIRLDDRRKVAKKRKGKRRKQIVEVETDQGILLVETTGGKTHVKLTKNEPNVYEEEGLDIVEEELSEEEYAHLRALPARNRNR